MSATISSSPAPRATRGRVGSARALQKGQQTKTAIIEAALGLATHIGLEGLSIGALADVMGMSKSGVFAHFGSREELQVSVIREYHHCFEQEVFYPAMSAPRGVPRLRALFDNWMKRTSIEIDSGCIYISGAIEQAKDLGQLNADVVEDQMLFEVHGLILALHYEARFLKNPGSIARALTGFDNLLARFSAQAPASPSSVPTPTSKE